MDNKYFTERIKKLEADFRKAQQASSHYGETGRSLEKSVKKLLKEYLPNKYNVDTGFVQSLEKPGWQSNQIDILRSYKQFLQEHFSDFNRFCSLLPCCGL